MKFFILTLSILALAASALAVSLSTSPNPKNTAVGESFVLSVNLDTATQIRGFSIRIGHDSGLLGFGAATRGSLFNGLNVGWWNVTAESPEITRIECILFGASVSATGPGTLINITFNALSEGYSAINFVSTILYDAAGNHISEVFPISGSIIIGSGHAYAKASCFLQGAFEAGSMSASLNEFIPLSSPYSADPIIVDSIPIDVVDWVLAELRSSPTGPAIKTQAMWLHTDGRITSPHKPFMFFMNTGAQGYYLAISHRNHLPIISNSPVSFVASGSPVSFNLSSLLNIHNPAAATAVGAGIYAMRAGDANADGVINHLDRNQQWRTQAGRQGYLSADFNLDGNVFPDDLNDLWRKNSGMTVYPINPIQAGLSIQIALPHVETIAGNPYFSFEIQVAATTSTARLGTGIILLQYNTTAFGTNLFGSNALRVSPDMLLMTGGVSPYNLIIKDYSEDCLALVYEYWGNNEAGSVLHGEPQSLLRLSFPIYAENSFSELDLLLPLMQNQQYRDDNSSRLSPVSLLPGANFFIPSAPTGLSLETLEGNLCLSWDAAPNRLYNVYSAPSPNSETWSLEASDLSTAHWSIPAGYTNRFYRIKSRLNQYGY